MIGYLLICLLTGLASALHGNDTLTKGLIIAGHVILVALVAVISLGDAWMALATLPAVAFYWSFLRRGDQADAELRAMDTKNHPKANAVCPHYILAVGACAIVLAFVSGILDGNIFGVMFAVGVALTALIPDLSVKIFNYDSYLGKKLGWNHGRFWDTRRATEFITGIAPGGVCIAAIIYSMQTFLNALLKL